MDRRRALGSLFINRPERSVLASAAAAGMQHARWGVAGGVLRSNKKKMTVVPSVLG